MSDRAADTDPSRWEVSPARALIRSEIGPCPGMMEHCPMRGGEKYRPGMCHVMDCPRRAARVGCLER